MGLLSWGCDLCFGRSSLNLVLNLVEKKLSTKELEQVPFYGFRNKRLKIEKIKIRLFVDFPALCCWGSGQLIGDTRRQMWDRKWILGVARQRLVGDWLGSGDCFCDTGFLLRHRTKEAIKSAFLRPC